MAAVVVDGGTQKHNSIKRLHFIACLKLAKREGYVQEKNLVFIP